MTNANDARKAHKILDDLFERKPVLDEEREFLRSALPELPKQKTLEEIIAHVRDAWVGANDNDWAGNSYDRDISIEDWMAELYVQMQGLKDVPTAVPTAVPTHPEFLETEEDYASAPRGTIAAKDGWLAWLKETDCRWSCGGGFEGGSSLARSGKRRILRWGWGK